MSKRSGESRRPPQFNQIIEAKGIAEGWGVPVCHTGAAGLAGLMQAQRAGAHGGEEAPPSVVILSGLDRGMAKEDAAEIRASAVGQ